MKSVINCLGVILLLAALPAEKAWGQIKPKTTGFGLRGSYWNMRSGSDLHFRDGGDYELVNLGGAGGWLYFFSRTSDTWFLELHLGGIADVIEQREYARRRDTRVIAIAPVLLGLRHPLVSPANTSALRPYLAFGGGPYWIGDILVQEHNYHEEEVTVASKLQPGAYAGGGMEFMLTSSFGLSFDVKYHFIDFDVHHKYSGYEYALGLQFCWGDYKPARKE